MSAAHAHQKESFITKYIFSQDHKMIGKQFLITAIFMSIVGVFLSVLFRIQLGWPGESNSFLNMFLGDTWAPDGVLHKGNVPWFGYHSRNHHGILCIDWWIVRNVQ